MKITVVGAGFAGLTLSHFLQKQGFNVTIYEKQESAGGLINTYETTHGLAESAANALLSDKNVEDLFVELGVEFAERGPASKKRYIFWDEPQRWPLHWKTSLLGARRLFEFMVLDKRRHWPEAGESIREWGLRVMNREFVERLMEPALQGIYAGDSRKLSANLILKSLTENRPPRGYYRGSVAPKEGMGALIEALKESLEEGGALFQFKTPFKMPDYVTNPVVIATGAWSAAELLQTSHPQIAKILAECESLQLARVSCFFEKSPADLEGFGCLFPTSQGFHSLGVLFDSCIFPNRSSLRAESWILGGTHNPEVTAWSDSQVIESVVQDREKFCGQSDRPVSYKISWWPRAVPYYTIEWEKRLATLKPPAPLFLHGNYLGQLGLSKILDRSIRLAKKIKDSYG
jgi:oxygen-dependent protoporphyrinogen oxidase